MKLFLTLCLLALTQAQDCTLDHCDSCTNPGIICEECDAGKVLSLNSDKCLSCPTKCTTCTANADDTTTCTVCNDATYLSASNECTDCQSGCKTCSLVNDVVTCSECMAEGYVADPDSVDAPCVECGSNCKTCTLADGATTCSACFTYPGEDKQGYYLKTSDKSCKSCGSKANQCSDDGTGSASITGCYSGYVVQTSDPANSRCLQCPSECSSCEGTELNSKATCSGCVDDLGNFLTSGECTSCTDNCNSCEDANNCADCNTGYRVDSGSCTACPAQCDECEVDSETGDDVCNECETNFGTKPTTSVTCDKCTENNCKSCTVTTSTGEHSCGTCIDAYAKNGDGDCVACPTGCTDCNWQTPNGADAFMQCTTCGTGYGGPFPAEADQTAANLPTCTACSSVDSQCTVCTAADPSVCTTCDTGYWYDAGNTACAAQDIANCVTYTANENVCTGCADGWAVNGDGSACVECTGTDCKLCAHASADICTECATGSVVYDSTGDGSNDKCETCGISRCTDCSITDNSGTLTKLCTTCETGYTMYDSSTKSTTEGTSCRSCVTGCDTCTYDYDNSVASCDTNGCSSKYIGKGDGTCEACPENCAICAWSSANSAAECSTCDSGYAVDGSSECTACPDNCNDCEYNSDTSAVECKSGECETGYGRLSGGTCEACPSSCDACTADENDELTCSTCQDGYAKNSLVCGACPSNCIECDDEDGTMVCTKCKEKYALDSTTKACMSCISNCDECTSSNEVVKCTDCKDGYSKSVDGLSCTTCLTAATTNCAFCEDMVADQDVAMCTACSTGFTLQDENPEGPCIDVSTLDCNADDKIDPAPQCTSCQSGFATNIAGLCVVNCYTCGAFPGTGVPTSECQIPSANSTGTTGFAQVEECAGDNDICVVYRLDNGNVVAGCAPDPEFNDNVAYTCTEEKEVEFCTDATINRCEKCCTTDLCNTYIAELDGTAFGVPSASVNVLLLCVAALLAFLRA